MSRPLSNPITLARLSVVSDLMTEDDVTWEDVPPKQVTGRRPYPRMESFIALLKENPGKTARFPEPFYGHPVSNLQNRWPDIEWAARADLALDAPKGQYILWGTYVEPVEADV